MTASDFWAKKQYKFHAPLSPFYCGIQSYGHNLELSFHLSIQCGSRVMKKHLFGAKNNPFIPNKDFLKKVLL